MRLEGKVAIVTGASKGIGQSIARRYAKEGAHVAIISRNQAESDAAAEAINAAGGKAFGVACDVGKLDQHQKLVDTVVEKAGRIDILVNNAGVAEVCKLVDLTEKDWDYVWDINVKGLAFLLQKVALQMIKQGDGGKIINVSSQAGRVGAPLFFNYGAGKAAVIHMTQSAALELIEHRINVNGIAPGVIDTPMWDYADEQLGAITGQGKGEVFAEYGAGIPFGRSGYVTDLDGAAVFLASKDSDYILAQTLNVDGGNVPS